MMPLKHLFKNKLLLQKHFNVNELAMNEWPYWMFEENVKIVNEITEEEEKQQKGAEDKQKQSMPNFNPSSMMNSMNSMANKFK